VDRGGRVPGPSADITTPLLWATCTQPKPPTENNSVSSACLDETLFPNALGPTPTTYSAPLPADPCSLFGPAVPPVQPPIRQRDPDVTGGYYVPIRVELLVPTALERSGMSAADALMSFHMQRMDCGLAKAKASDIIEYNATYRLNNNPALTSLTVHAPGGDTSDWPATRDATAPIPAAAGQTLSLTANWPSDSVESYPAMDVLSGTLVTHWEAMRVSWYATGGSFEHDVTGRGEDEHDVTFTENSWTPDAPGLVHMWIVLHDTRGGTDFASFDIQVDP